MQVIRDLLTPKTYVIVVEHDLAVLDYLSDFICCLYGKPGALFTWVFSLYVVGRGSTFHQHVKDK